MSSMAATYMQQAAARLSLHNPSPYPRRGAIVTDWAPIAAEARIDPERVKVTIGVDRLRAQVDRIDPRDPSRDQLVFLLDNPLNEGDENYTFASAYANVNEGDPDDRGGPLAEAYPTGAKVRNERGEFWVNTSATYNNSHAQCFGGAITSMLQYRQGKSAFELLDGIASNGCFLGHPEKRIQVDRVRLALPAWDDQPHIDVALHDKPWTLIAAGQGPARSWATIESQPFLYEARDVRCECAVLRTFSLFHDDDAVHEQIWIRARTPSGEPAELWFSARFFMMTDLGPEPVVFRYPNIAGWFVIAAEKPPFHGYTFASNAAVGPIWMPPLDWPDRDLSDRAFAWELAPAHVAQCIHSFRFGRANTLGDVAGWTWYASAFKSLRAKLM